MLHGNRLIAALTSLALLVAAISGCSNVRYYAHLAQGHWSLWSNQQPIENLLKSQDTPVELRRRLQQALKIRQFASHELGLPDNPSYTRYSDTQRRYSTWNVTATEPFSLQPLEWCFLLVGCLPYRGYFDAAMAEHYRDGLQQQGYDAIVWGAAAYSTLGWFDDPVLNTMLRWDDARLAEVIFHELTHQQFYVADRAELNEAVAVVTARTGVRRWLRSQQAPQQLARYELQLGYHQGFLDLIGQTRVRLQQLYQSTDSKLSEKRAEFERLKQRYAVLRDQWNGYSGYDAWFARDLNNAHLATVSVYNKLVPGLEQMLSAVDGDLQQFFVDVEQLAQRPVEEIARLLSVDALPQ